MIENVPLGLLAAAANPGMAPLAGLLPAVPAGQRRPARPPAPPDNSRPFAGLFNTGSQPSGYTPQDVQKIIGDRASYYQNFPIVPMWNGGRGAGGILPGIANFGAGFMGSYTQGDQQRRAQENERIRRQAGDTAAGATTLEDAVRALQGGSPEQSSAALQIRLQALLKDRERERQAQIMQQIYGAPPEAPAPTAAPPSAASPPVADPDAIVRGAQQQNAANNGIAPFATETTPAQPIPVDQPPVQFPSATVDRLNAPNPLVRAWSILTAPQRPNGQGFGLDIGGERTNMQSGPVPSMADQPSISQPVNSQPQPTPQTRPQHSFNIEGMTPQQMAQLPLNRPSAELSSGAPAPPQTAPTQQPAQVAQPEPVVQIGQFRLPLSEARRRAALGRAQGIDVKPLEEAIQLAEEPLRAQARERGQALGQAQASLPQAIQAAQSTIEKIDEISNDPQLQRIIGWQWWAPQRYMPNSPAQEGLVERIKQVQGRFFLQAFDALRGTGQISNTEGEKAQAAIARIQNINQDQASYATALEDARREVWSLTNTARQRAGLPPVPYQPAPPQVGAVRDGYRFNGGDPANPASWQRVQ
jgi:hypothetical protein